MQIIVVPPLSPLGDIPERLLLLSSIDCSGGLLHCCCWRLILRHPGSLEMMAAGACGQGGFLPQFSSSLNYVFVRRLVLLPLQSMGSHVCAQSMVIQSRCVARLLEDLRSADAKSPTLSNRTPHERVRRREGRRLAAAMSVDGRGSEQVAVTSAGAATTAWALGVSWIGGGAQGGRCGRKRQSAARAMVRLQP